VSIEWFRDLVICIFGLGATVVILALVTLAFMMYFRIKPIVDSVKATSKTVENISSTVEVEVARPLAQVAAFVQGLRQAMNLVGHFTKKKEADCDE
jgi:Na+-transporting methylmalonyl-CoA/oxaloacetate decarboxylase gamma subunit